jgi:tetratricopeptide (TPR) repeat protein
MRQVFPTLSVAESMVVAWRHYHAGTRQDAAIISARALQIESTNADAHRVLGLVYYRKGRLKQAIEEFQRAQRLGLNSADLQGHLAKAYEELDAANARA